MGPHSVLRVRGGQPLSGGPSFDPEDISYHSCDSLSENSSESEVVRAGQPRFHSGPNFVLGPLREESKAFPSAQSVPSRSASPIAQPLHVQVESADASSLNKHHDVNNPSLSTAVGSSTLSGQEEKNSKSSEQFQNPLADPDQFQMVVSGLTKTYQMGKVKVPVLKGVDLTVKQGEFLSIVGQSGSGKSTLLHLLGTLDFPDSGSIYFDGQRIDNLSGGQRDILRNRFIGMIFQFYHLLPELSTLENVLAPLMIQEGFWSYLSNRTNHKKKGMELLDAVGLSHRLFHKPNELSGGEMQRAAIARALIAEPQILLADEPTGNLDTKTAKEIIQLLRKLNRERQLTVVMVTHDLALAQQADRMIRIRDGIVELDYSEDC